MAAIHVSQAEAARDFAALMAKVKGGDEVVIEENAVPVAVLHAPAVPRRSFEEIIAMLPKNSPGVVDEDFARDVAKGIRSISAPVAEPHTPAVVGRPLAECVAMLSKDSDAVIDEDFARDLAEVIALHREPLGSPEWD